MERIDGLVIQRVALASLHQDPANVRLHDAANLEAIKGSLARFGQQKPIVVDQKGMIRAGNGTYAAAVALGWKEIDVVVTDLEGVEAVAFAIADNRTSDLSRFDDEALVKLLGELQAQEALDGTGFTGGDLDGLLAELQAKAALEVEEDVVPDPPDAAVTRPGDLWVLGEHRLLCGDSSSTGDVDRLLAGAPVHLVNTDPPYNVKVEPRSNNAIAAGLSVQVPPPLTGLDRTTALASSSPVGLARGRDAEGRPRPDPGGGGDSRRPGAPFPSRRSGGARRMRAMSGRRRPPRPEAHSSHPVAEFLLAPRAPSPAPSLSRTERPPGAALR